MLLTVILLSITCGFVKSSGFHPIAVPGTAPVVTASSSQYFERTFNRLVQAPLHPVVPIAPVAPFAPAPPIIPVIPLPPARPVVVDAKTTSVPVSPTLPPQPQSAPLDPNIAIAIATANAAAPVATFLLPPYPFGLPPNFGLAPQGQQPSPTPTDPSINRESTTQRTTAPQVKTTIPQVKTTEREQEITTAVPSNIDNSFAQALPSNQNVNFRQYLAPSPPRVPSLPPPIARPQKFKTNVEVVPVPLAYIAPPPAKLLHHHHHQHHHHHHQHQALRAIPHFHTFIPKTRIIIRPVNTHRMKNVKIPVKNGGFVTYGPPGVVKKVVKRYPQNIRSIPRDVEPTTFRPISRPITKPPRV